MTSPAVARPWSPGAADLPRAAASFVRGRAVRIRRAAPLGAVLFTALVGHAAVAPHLAVQGVAPDVLLVGLTAVAAERGPRAGAAFGFTAGLGADLFLATPLGTSALAFTLVGHVLGQSRPTRSPGRPSGVAAALCSPASTCFACRAGRLHTAAPLEAGQSGLGGSPPADEWPGRPEWSMAAQRRAPARRRRRAVARRASVRRTLVLTGVGVGLGRLATASVATALAGVPFPALPGLVRIAAVAAVSAPLGPPLFAAVSRLPGTASGGGR